MFVCKCVWDPQILYSYLPKYEMLSDDGPHSIVTPHIPIQALAGKILHILDVDH